MTYRILSVLLLGGILANAHAQESMQPAADKMAVDTPTAGEGTTEPGAVMPAGSVTRAVFTSAIENREPVDAFDSADTATDNVYFFTELRDMEGQTVTHRWSYDGEQMAAVRFDVGGPRWRVWSSKRLQPEWVGAWTAEVIDSNGNVVASETLQYTAATADDDAAEAAMDKQPAKQ